ncbi:endonuclease III [Candidatus Woesearchaeota archaeon]|nr:endonuclease III [Candidatus Woesearchaeota archaeon]
MDSKISKQIKLLEKNYPNVKFYLNFSNPLELLVASILSAQCTDQVVNVTTLKLFKKYKTAKDYATADVKELELNIKSVNFFRKKAENIIKACQILEEKYQGKIPSSMNKLIELPGISRKTANVIQQNAFNIIDGIVVDSHVIRVTQRLGWTKNKNPEKIENDLMNLFPKDKWKILPHLLKNHGRAICKPPVPICSKCFLNKLCPKIVIEKFN